MFSPSSLPLHAELLLLAHDPVSGKRLIPGQYLQAGLAGAALLELNLQGALDLDGEGRQSRLRATGVEVAPELGPLLARADGHAPKKAVARIGGAQSFKKRADELGEVTWRRLAGDGLVRSQQHKVWGLFPTVLHFPLSTEREGSVVTIRAAIAAADQPDVRTSGLIAVLAATRLLPKLLPELGGKERKARVKQIAASDWSGDAVAKAISEVQAAIVASVVVPAVSTTAAS